MATSAEFEAIISTLSDDELMQLKCKLSREQIVRMTMPALLSTVQLDNLCEDIADAYQPVRTAMLAII